MTTSVDRAADWLSQLVRIPSVNPVHAGERAGVPGEAALARALGEWMTDLGATSVELADVPGADGRPNMCAQFRGDSDRWLCLDVHMDTVGVEHMTRDPFDGAISEGRVWGRGSVDTKASMAVMMAALETLQREGRRPRANLLVVGTVAEEAAGLLGAVAFNDWIKRHGIVADELLIAEPTHCAPVYGHKGGLGIEFTVRGKAAHSSRPDLGHNAVVAAAQLILAFQAKHEALQTGIAATPLGHGTLSPTVVSGGMVRNIIPDSCKVYVGRRLVPGEDPDVVRDDLIEFARANCPLPVDAAPQIGMKAVYGSPDSPLCQRVSGWTGLAPDVSTLGTNAFKYDNIAKDFIVFGPGSVEQAHAAEEWCALTQLETAVGVFDRWLRHDPSA